MNTPHTSQDPQLDEMLATVTPIITPDRVHRVRTAILVAAHNQGRQSVFASLGAFFGFRPAVLMATCLLGLVLGASLPPLSLDQTGSAAFLDYHPQGFLTGDFG